MEFRVVLQFSASSVEDFDELVALEDRLSAALGESASVDGHDFGSGEFNVFIFTDDAKSAWKTLFEVLTMSTKSAQMRAGFRRLEADEYTPLWPPDLKEFTVR